MKENNLSSVIRVFGWGILLGGAAGLAAGLLLAPEEGSRLRRRVTYRLESLGKQITDLADQLLSPEADSEARRHGNAIVADAQERADNIQRDIDALLGDMREQGPAAPKED